MSSRSYAGSIQLPDTNIIFRNIKSAKRFAIDIGGSLTKIAYYSTIAYRKALYNISGDDSQGTNQQSGGSESDLYETSEIERLHFVKFETKYIEQCLDFLRINLLGRESVSGKIIKVTGGGAYKYSDLIQEKLGLIVDKEDEMACLIKGCNFLLRNIPDEQFEFDKHGDPQYKFINSDPNIFPYLLVNIGSGVSIMKVESDSSYERIGGTSLGGGTFWGLGSLLTGAHGFDELLDLASEGDHRNVDLLVKDIYGGAYSALGLPGDIIASSFGKAMHQGTVADKSFSKADIARSLLYTVSNDIGQIASLYAMLHKLGKVYFGGYFLRCHPMSQHSISYAIRYWSKGAVQTCFLRHEGYLGAVGAFLMGAEEEDSGLYSWGENYAGSSCPLVQNDPMTPSSCWGNCDQLEMDKCEQVLMYFPLLANPTEYVPDTVDLTQDKEAREYWVWCFESSLPGFVDRAVSSQACSPDAAARARMFRDKFLERLQHLNTHPFAFGHLTVRSLLDLREHCLNEFDFPDPYLEQKKQENIAALELLSERLQYIDSLPDDCAKNNSSDSAERADIDDVLDDYDNNTSSSSNKNCSSNSAGRAAVNVFDSSKETGCETAAVAVITGLLAGNVFDWGAKEVVALMTKGLSFRQAVDKLQPRPWLIDDLDAWVERLRSGPPHKCAYIFLDNSGCDVVLGVLPFARYLLGQGTKVVLCANSRPALNDVTVAELQGIVERACMICPTLLQHTNDGTLSVISTGHGSPCLDFSRLPRSLVEAASEECDLVVVEGMGRAIHTNLEARFTCDVLKVAVIKNSWLAKRLGGEMFSVMCKYEPAGSALDPSPASTSTETPAVSSVSSVRTPAVCASFVSSTRTSAVNVSSPVPSAGAPPVDAASSPPATVQASAATAVFSKSATTAAVASTAACADLGDGVESTAISHSSKTVTSFGAADEQQTGEDGANSGR
uniref:4'-phosphopantetheine phosphatase n=2 Tax=Hirondellea gigas TaxID=1518452 RepID=A0A6A7G058_9CRUS